MGGAIKVLFVDDNPRMRTAWARLLKGQPDIELVGTLSNADNLTETAKQTAAQVVMIDLVMPGRDACEAIKELVRDCRDCKVIVHSALNDAAETNRALAAGACHVVDKLDEPRSIVDSIRQAAGL